MRTAVAFGAWELGAVRAPAVAFGRRFAAEVKDSDNVADVAAGDVADVAAVEAAAASGPAASGSVASGDEDESVGELASVCWALRAQPVPAITIAKGNASTATTRRRLITVSPACISSVSAPIAAV